MKARSFLGLCAALMSNWLSSQVAIEPTWARFVPSSTRITRLALDQNANRLHLAYQPAPANVHTHIRAFHTDGTDIPPPYSELAIGTFLPATSTTGSPTISDQPLRLLALDDTIYFMDHYLDQVDYMSWYRATRISLDSTTAFSMHTGSDPLVDMIHDASGDITVSPTIVRSYSKRYWLRGRAIVPTTDRIAADSSRIYCGRLPSIAALDRDQMTLLSPISVPSSGISVRTLLELRNSVIHYASLNSNLTMDIGAVDTSGAAIWSSTLTADQYTTLSGIALDGAGNLWMAASTNGSMPMGRLFRFGPLGTLTGNYTYGRTIDDIVSSDDHIFISGWDSVDATMVYLAAFATDLTTGVSNDTPKSLSISPNPANEVLFLHGTTAWAEGWIMDAMGKKVVTLSQADISKRTIAINELAVGTYRLCLRNSSGSSQHPFVIMR